MRRSVGVAMAELRAEGLVPVVEREWTTYAEGKVVSQDPEFLEYVEPGSEVTVVVSRELLEVPYFGYDASVRGARRRLHRLGFEVRVERRSRGLLASFSDPGDLLDTRPGPFTTRRPGSVVTLIVAAPPPDSRGDCHPSYSGCVPRVSDVDCLGGSGDGPEYIAGPVQVSGPDDYDLDSDGNGIACE
jgi:beta-lactam-binding protein with PASTA domain